MADIKIDDTVDITDVVCPVTFVKAKVALEEPGDQNERWRASTECTEKRKRRRTSDPET